MVHELVVALTMILATAPGPMDKAEPMAPAGGPETRYCMRVEAATGSRIERIWCWTREQWAEQEVDLDAEWAKEGVRVLP